jgi:hypothetical protein
MAESGVDAVKVHVRDARVRIEAALASLLVFHGVVHHRAVTRAHPAQGAQPLLAAEQLLAHLEALLAIRVADQLRRLIAVFWFDVVTPEIERLQNVSVGIDDIIGASHGRPSFSA